MKKLKKIISTILITVALISNTQSLVLYANENTNNIIEIEDVNSNSNAIWDTDKKEKAIDTIKPELISIEVDKKEVKVGEEIEVTVEAKDEGGSGIEKVLVYYSSPITYKTKSILLKLDTDGKYRGKLKLTDEDESGEWLVYNVLIADNAENCIDVFNSKNPNVLYSWYKKDLSHCNFKLTERSNEKPEIYASDVIINVGDVFNPMNGVMAIDKEDGNITHQIQIIENEVDTTKVGEYKVVYKVVDSKGASTTKTIKVRVKEINIGGLIEIITGISMMIMELW